MSSVSAAESAGEFAEAPAAGPTPGPVVEFAPELVSGSAPEPAAGSLPPLRSKRAVTREQFLMREVRIVARLRLEGDADEEIVDRAADENVFQYPTASMRANIARACLFRLNALGAAGPEVVRIIALGEQTQASQANLYAMARAYDIVWEFLTRVVGLRYATLDYSLTAGDINVFLADMQADVPEYAAWSPSTLVKTRQVLRSALIHAGNLAGPRSEELVPVFLDPEVECAIRRNGDVWLLPAFNCMEVA